MRTVRDRHKTLGPFDQHTRLQTTVGEFVGKIKYGTICKLEEDLAGCLNTVSQLSGAQFSLEKAAEDPADHRARRGLDGLLEPGVLVVQLADDRSTGASEQRADQ